jgi:multidrug efflux system membrane fusion protein
MKGSCITAVAIVVGAAAWIASGHFLPRESAEGQAAVRPAEAETKPFRVAVMPTELVPPRQRLVLSGRTEADRKVMVTARTGGVLTDLRVRRGSAVKKGEIIAVLSDEAREAQVEQARTVVAQRRKELEARSKLIASGTMPRLELGNLEAALKIAEAQLAQAEAEYERGHVRAPWDGIINDVPVEVGGAAFSIQGREIAQLVALDPMLAVVEVAERRLGGIAVGDEADIRLVDGQTARGRVRFISKTASPATRTYRVEIEIPNADGKIPDGLTAEVAILLAPVMATRVPRSALTFSSAGELGVRTVNGTSEVVFRPVTIVEDEHAFMWVAGIADGERVIVEGQDFVREGQRVLAVNASESLTRQAASR